ncbi:putative PEP-CTERM system histidine kinase [Nitrosomonas cryotolerans]|uniref:histidine kinase n=1 Tax=Nitrosomonas cryotolerans ATCC 49181 TaxID=1131553 RepID=A0A1N6JAY9_9PROT|nr:XrtA/PEP-CTERM system histidine kinase PrsK [Nitrosomonas cryotolerans]SFP47968.1 putative PEP-CTERM system histidine kinase [Nitrosomonas cryotolerans]SIO41498.1 putative PEP-CTERM system histidine kinase [Nitrosomonas cryotolerans ATCC 49181]
MLTNIATISYAIAAIAYLFLSILLLTSWRGRLYGMMLTVACLFSALWATALACQAAWGYPTSYFTNILEILRNASWSAFLILVLGPFQYEANNTSHLKTRSSVVIIALFYLVFFIIALFSYKATYPLFDGAITFLGSSIGGVVMAIIGVILIEQFYRNTPIENRWGIKFICLGIGGVFIYDFYLYSDALLFRSVNVDIWAARGGINALIVPLIAISAARNPRWAVGIAVSRHILFYSTALFGTAIYLLVMAVAGYYLRFSGGSWGTVLQMTFLFGAVILLIGILFSGTIRSWLKVFISKHFFSYEYDYREEWLRFTRTLSEGGHDLRERVIEALAQLVESPGGGLWLNREADNFELTTHWNIAVTNQSEAVNSPFCQFLENKEWVVDLLEYNANPEKYAAIILPQWLHDIPRAWLVIPLILHRKMLGFVILLEPRSRIKVNWEVTDLLKVAGNQAASYLAQDEATRALLVARQFESFNRMSTFVVHDLKNLIFQLSLLLSNAEKHKDNPEFQNDMIQTVNLSINKMKRLLEKLSNVGSTEESTPLLLDQLLLGIVENKSVFEPRPVLEVYDHHLIVSANRSRFERVLGHLIQNAIEATPKSGQVRIRLMKQNKHAIVEIQDTGHGMSEEFISDRLFRPFESTKSAGMGIGVFESREYVNEIGGRLEVTSTESIGTVFRLVLQLQQQDCTMNTVT